MQLKIYIYNKFDSSKTKLSLGTHGELVLGPSGFQNPQTPVWNGIDQSYSRPSASTDSPPRIKTVQGFIEQNLHISGPAQFSPVYELYDLLQRSREI